MNVFWRISLAGCIALLALAGCGSSSSSMPPAQAGTARVRFADGAPVLETIINGEPEGIGAAYLQVNGSTVVSSFSYGGITEFFNLTPGTKSLVARDELGYAVGPLKSAPLSAGKRYTLIVVGTYPKYRVLTFEEPAISSNAQLSLYEASPTVPQTGFGSFRASSHSDFKQLATASLGSVKTVNLGKSVSDFGGYAGKASSPLGTLTPKQLNAFDKHNVLPFHVAARLSLFLFDPSTGSVPGPLFGNLDQ
jgi:hypothetical protein